MCSPMLRMIAVHRQVFSLFFTKSCGQTERKTDFFFFF